MQQVDAVAGADAMAFVDVDDTIRQTHGYAKQGVAYGYSGVGGLDAQLAVVSTPAAAPVIAAAWLRRFWRSRRRGATAVSGPAGCG